MQKYIQFILLKAHIWHVLLVVYHCAMIHALYTGSQTSSPCSDVIGRQLITLQKALVAIKLIFHLWLGRVARSRHHSYNWSTLLPDSWCKQTNFPRFKTLTEQKLDIVKWNCFSWTIFAIRQVKCLRLYFNSWWYDLIENKCAWYCLQITWTQCSRRKVSSRIKTLFYS